MISRSKVRQIREEVDGKRIKTYWVKLKSQSNFIHRRTKMDWKNLGTNITDKSGCYTALRLVLFAVMVLAFTVILIVAIQLAIPPRTIAKTVPVPVSVAMEPAEPEPAKAISNVASELDAWIDEAWHHGVNLTLDDLPHGFVELPPTRLGLTQDFLDEGNFTVGRVFAFEGDDEKHQWEDQLVLGCTTLLPTWSDQVAFDRILDHPHRLLRILTKRMGATAILVQDQLPGLEKIGDAAAGMSVVFDTHDTPRWMDIVTIRRGDVGALVAVIRPIDQNLPVTGTVQDYATTLDGHIEDLYRIKDLSANSAEPEMESAPATPGPTTSTATVTTKDLCLRAGPGMGYKVLGGLSAGQKVKIIDQSEDTYWLQIKDPRDPEGVGWIAAGHVTVN
jgi:hypothetical protein